LTAGYLLHKDHDVHIYEARDRIGGHTATAQFEYENRNYEIDMGFIIFNEKTYPNFCRLLQLLGVAKQPTAMGFSVSNKSLHYEFGTSNLRAAFAQTKNIFSFRHWAFILEILRFNRLTKCLAQSGDIDADMTLAGYVDQHGFSDHFVTHYLIPLTSIIWSQDTIDSMRIPLHFFVEFFITMGCIPRLTRTLGVLLQVVRVHILTH